jgi:predicted metalloendopeptidase
MLFASGAVFAAESAPLGSGIDMQNADNSVSIRNDFYQHVNGAWLKKIEIPADKASWGSFDELYENSLTQLRGIIETAAKAGADKPGSEEEKIGNLYNSFMDEKTLDALDLKPLEQEFARINGLTDKKQIAALIAHYNRVGIDAPFAPNVHLDNKDSTKYVVDFGQSGLDLPDRDYYLNAKDAKLKEARAKYLEHITKMLSMRGDKNAAKEAKDIMALETAIAKVQWTEVENRDPIKAYNKIELAKLDALTPGFDWKSYMTEAGTDGKLSYVIVSQPSYMKGLAKLFQSTPLSTWKEYFSYHVLSSSAPYLSTRFSKENFAFKGTALYGVPEQKPRWKRAISVEESAIGEGVGKLYVAQYFPPENKARMEQMVANLLKAFDQSVDTLDWMGPETKKEAKAKLASFTPKIGYPSKWRDYSALQLAKDDLYGNIVRANEFEYNRNLSKLGQPVDRSEWTMTPQTVNAYYNPEMNEIVFPAAILQPPFFNAQADDAVNYGSIGAVIGHEISHGFDDQGAQYDGTGNLRDWWTKADHEKFSAKTAALVKQYSAFSPLPGYHVNGELTLGENIADNSGLAIAFKAYKLSLNGQPAPEIDGLTGAQRFYLGFGQIWRGKMRDNMTIALIKTNPHSPEEFRGNGTVKNQPGFYEAFGIKEGDAMYLPPDQRVLMW